MKPYSLTLLALAVALPMAACTAEARGAPAAPVAVDLVLDEEPCANCCAAVRGALEPLDGVSKVDVTAGDQRMRVEFDPTRLDVERLLQVLAAADQPAKRAE